MKITEIIQTKFISAIQETITQYNAPLDVVSKNRDQPQNLESYIDEGIGQILRRIKGKGLKTGFRCLAGPRKGRIVANASTCMARLNPKKGAKIRQKRLAKAKATARKRSRTIGAGGASRRLSKIQIGQRKGTARPKKGTNLRRGRGLQKSKIINPKK